MRTLEWTEELKVGEKFKDMRNCPLDVVIYGEDLEQAAVKDKSLEPQRKIAEVVAERLNFIPNFADSSDIQIGLRMDMERNKDFEFAVVSPFTEDRMVFAITPAEEYKPYEKILLPFDELTWYLLLGTFGFSFGAIFAVSLMRKRWQDVVYGEGVRMPAYNVVGTFFGISQMRLPTTFFARALLLHFIWFCLIFRTAYQGVFFEMFTTDMRKPQPRTFNDLIERNYTIKGNTFFFVTMAHWRKINPFASYNESLKDFTDLVDELKRENYSEVHGNFEFYQSEDDVFNNICDVLMNSSAKTAYLGNFNFITRVQQNCSFEPEVLEEVMYENVVGLTLSIHHYLYSYIANVTQRLVEAGIVQSWYDFYQFVNFRVVLDPVDTNPKVLTLEKLSFGFIIFLGACGVAVAVFICEIVWFRIFGKKDVKRPVEVQVNPTVEAAEEEDTPVNTEKIARMFRVVDAEEPKLPTIAVESLEKIKADDELTVAIEIPEDPEEQHACSKAAVNCSDAGSTTSSEEENEVSVISLRSPFTVYAEVHDELFLEDIED
jgi:hypothetical protein